MATRNRYKSRAGTKFQTFENLVHEKKSKCLIIEYSLKKSIGSFLLDISLGVLVLVNH